MNEVFPRPFGRYTLLGNLGQGGMGALYLACHGATGLEKLCVIKTVLPSMAAREYVARFSDEAKIVVKLSHGNLVPVFDAGMVHSPRGDQMYIAMEFVEGKDLRAVWNRCAHKGVAFPIDIAVYIARELARGLHHAHTFGNYQLVHRDVSPPNVLISFSGEVRLTDFGLAASTLKTERTAPGIVYGKVSYMSPEQARGEGLDAKTDQYAIGILLYEMLTGKQIFPQSEPNLIERVRNPSIVPPGQITTRVNAALDTVVMTALHPTRESRFADCEGLRAALAGVLAQIAPTTDNARVKAFLEQLFGEEIESERQGRERLMAEVGRAPLPNPEGDPLVGRLLDDRYRIEKRIGEGGMGVVYEAEHAELGRRVAVKVLHANFSQKGELVARFRSEARAASKIGHPNIIDVFDSGTTADGSVYLVMEHLDGCDLAHVIENGPLPQARVMAISRQLAQALGAAHQAGIVHRDLKPENVFLVERSGQKDFVKVLDFGIAKTMDAVPDRAGRLTNPGVAMGTPEYMAPEQAAGHPADARADIYSVGALMYEMLSGRPPVSGANMMEILTKKATEDPTAISNLRPDLSAQLDRLIMRSLAREPEVRPQSMGELLSELNRLDGIPGAVPFVPTAKTGLRPLWAISAGAVAAAAMIALTIGLVLRAPAAPELPATKGTPRMQEAQVAAPTAPVRPVAAPRPVAPAIAPSEAASAPRPARPKPANPVRVASAKRAENPRLRDEARRCIIEGRQALNVGSLNKAAALFQRALESGYERAAAQAGLDEVERRR